MIVEDRWLSERFGHPLFTVEVGADPEQAARAVDDHTRDLVAASYQARVPAERREAAEALTGSGFAIVNETITLAREPGALEASAPGIEVRAADPDGDTAVLDIAERSFTLTRFHRDPRIPVEVANRIKRDWAANSLDGGRGDGMLVAVRDGEVVGFLAGLSSEEEGRAAKVIDLIAVDPESRNSGAGAALVARFVEDAEGSHDEVRVGSQDANEGATRLYERLGFRTVSSAFDLHRHTGTAWAGGGDADR